MSSRSTKDKIRINDLFLTVPLLTGAVWPKPAGEAALQPLLVSLSITHDISTAATHDDLKTTINYSHLCKILREALSEKTPAFETLAAVLDRILDLLFGSGMVEEVEASVVQTRAPLNCRSIAVGALAKSKSAGWEILRLRHYVNDLQCLAIIGVNACEREERQTVRVNVTIEDASTVHFRALTRHLHQTVVASSYLTLEALTSHIAEHTLQNLDRKTSPVVTVRAAKPCAIVFAGSSEIEVSRSHDDFPQRFDAQPLKVTIALGSNLGDRFQNIEHALRLLECPETPGSSVAVVDTSFMYETAPMYVTDQPSFINCACLIETNMQPLQLLEHLKRVENLVGRVPSIRNGPRAVDLDIVLCGDLVIDTRKSPRKELDDLEGELVVPHPRLGEREFVLRPLNDMIPDSLHPVSHQTIGQLLSALPESSEPMNKVLPYPVCRGTPAQSAPTSLKHWVSAGKTYLMATLNTTPDSFSDGATHNTLPTALRYARDAVAAGADILDVGGYSTRPGAAHIESEEEIARVAPFVSAVRAEHPDLLMSVDTFRPEVARAALEAGANCINDVYAFTGPDAAPDARCMEQMKALARAYAVPVVLMHSRGEASGNKDYSAYDYAGKDNAVVEGIRVELGAKIDAIVKGKGGVRRWLVIADPGVGFSKTVDGNLQVLRKVSDVAEEKTAQGHRNPLHGLPQLIGTSRKSFLGLILEKASGRKTEPKERSWATAAAVACAVQQGAAVVRVHDVQEMRDVLDISDALWAR